VIVQIIHIHKINKNTLEFKCDLSLEISLKDKTRTEKQSRILSTKPQNMSQDTPITWTYK